VNDRVVAERPSKLNRRATAYLRWYPSTWRARYGNEFVAHLEAELEERPLSYVRGLNIALHGVTARFRLERGFRWFIGVGLVVAMVAALVIGALASEVRYPALPLSLNDNGGAGIPTRPTTVNNFNYRFTNHSSVRIRLLHVSLIGYKDYPVPHIVRVQIDPRHQMDALLDLPSTTPGLVPALGRSVVLGNNDSIDVSMVAPIKGRLYAVAGLNLEYERKGVDHTATTPLRQGLDLLCVEPRSSDSLESPYCTRSFTTAFALWGFYNVSLPHQAPAQHEALTTVTAALSYAGGAELRTPNLRDVRDWATRLFAHRGLWRIAGVTATKGNETMGNVAHELIFRLVLVKRGTSERTVVCVQNGLYESGAEISPEVTACPTP
jgi:hypothetical protein